MGTKPAQTCPICGKRTKGRQGLKAHMRDQHDDGGSPLKKQADGMGKEEMAA